MTDGILKQNSVRRTFKCVAMFDHVSASLVFVQSAMGQVYPCDIHKVPKLLTGKKGHLKKEVPSVAMMTNFGFGARVENYCPRGEIPTWPTITEARE